MSKILVIFLFLIFFNPLIVSATSYNQEKNPFFDRRLFDFTPQEIAEMNKARKEKEQQELIQKALIVAVVLIAVFIGFKKFRNSRGYQFAKDYSYMLKLIDIAKSQNTPEHSIAVLCRREKSFSVVNEIYAFCITRENLSEVVNRHNAKLRDFEEIYQELTIHCCADSGDKYIPVSAFFL